MRALKIHESNALLGFVKPIEKVKPGDIAIDREDNNWEVLDSGIGHDSFKKFGHKYDESGVMDSFFDDLLNYPEDYPGAYPKIIEWIACFDEKFSESTVFHYGPDGAYVQSDKFSKQDENPYRTLGVGRHNPGRFKKFTKMHESAASQTMMNIRNELTSFLTGVVIPQSKGHVTSERTAALHLYDILKERYKIEN